MLKPEHVLDLGCGCGSFTAEMSPHCGKIIAIDSSSVLIDRCKSENQKPNINYVCMDARKVDYPDACFNLVLERACLHHILEWEKVLDEMMRLSSKYVLIEEPMDDPRSDAKRNAIQAQRFYLEVQKEAGFQGAEMKCLVLKTDTSFIVYITLQGNKVNFDKIRRHP